MNTLGLIPLINFGEVLPNIYRSAQPFFNYQYEWIKHVLGVDVIVNIRSEARMDEKFIQQLNLGITPVNYDVVDHKTPTIEQAKDYAELVRECQRDGNKMLIHCEHGHGRTSTFSVLAKMAMGQNVEDAIKDENDRFHYNFKHRSQELFLRNIAEK